MHADLYSSKFPPRTLKCIEQSGYPLANQTSGGAGRSDEGEFGQAGVRDAYLRGEGRRQAVPDALENGDFALTTGQKTGEGRFGR